MDWKADIIGLERVETPEIPVEAVREAVINSYGHRVYNNGQNNEIDVFKDRIEIHTTGGFPKGHTPEEYLDGNKKPIRRNRRITGVLYYSKDMETFATGLKRIKDLCDEAGCKVEFRTEKDDFVVVFYRDLRDSWNNNEIGGAKNGVNGVNDVNNGADDKERKDAIIECIKEDTYITIGQMVAVTGIPRRTVDRILKQMKENGVLERKGSSRSGYWILHL